MDIIEGQVVKVDYPFSRTEYTPPPGEDGNFNTILSWRPGIWYLPNGHDDADVLADGMGKMILSVVSIHKPGKWPARVFYVREWKTPDGKVFGKQRCKVMAQSAFKGLLRGYRHDFKMATESQIQIHIDDMKIPF